MGLTLDEMACLDMGTFGLMCDEWRRMHGGGSGHTDEVRAATQADIDRVF